MSEQPRRILIHRSINRPQVLLGGERKLVQSSMFISFLVGIAGMSLYSIAFAIVIWAILMAVLRRLAKSDAQMSSIYTRSIHYKAYYPAKSGLKAMPKSIQDWRK